jgi:hypothetical protein
MAMDTSKPNDFGSPERNARIRFRRGTLIGGAVTLASGSAAGLLALTIGSSAATTTLVVDTLDDGAANAADCTTPVANSCSLRDAVAAVAQGDTITFESGLNGTITLTNGEITSSYGTTITGPGSTDLTIDANQASRVFSLVGTTSSDDFTISGLTLTNGKTQDSGNGGALDVSSARNVVLNDVVFTGNSTNLTQNVGAGGAASIHNSGSLPITDSVFTDNHATLKGGAAFLSSQGDVNITRTTVTGNTTDQRGGGFYLLGRNSDSQVADLTITDSTFSNNEALQDGGGAYIFWNSGGSVEIRGTTVSGNSAKRRGVGAFLSTSQRGAVTIEDSTFTSNIGLYAYGTQYGEKGGGAYVYYATSVTVSNSTFDSNTASKLGGGLGVGRSGPTVVNNSTFTGNTSLEVGGGIGVYATELTVNQSTISGNAATASLGTSTGGGGGIYFYGSELTLSGSIVSGNTNSDPLATIGEDIESDQHGSLYLHSQSSIVGYVPMDMLDDLGGTIISSAPGLYALADNGGPTKTMALTSSSIAIDAGPDPIASFAGNLYDQRGAPRPTGVSGDIGSFEFGGTPASTTSTTTTPGSTTTSSSTSTSTTMYFPTTTTSPYIPSTSSTSTTMYFPTTTTSPYIPSTSTTSTTISIPTTTTSVAPTTSSTAPPSSSTSSSTTSTSVVPSSTSSTTSPAPSSTSTTLPGAPTTTLNVSPGAPATPLNASLAELSLGNAIIIQADGSTTPAPVVTTGSNVVLSGSRTFGVELTGTRASDSGQLTFTAGGAGRVVGYGFQPGTTTSVWMMSSPQLLGTATVQSDGTFALQIAVSSDLEGKNHTIQVQGVDTQGSSRAIATGVLVATRTSLPVTGNDSQLPLVLGGSLLLGGAGLGLTAQTRRRQAGGISRSTSK